MHTRQTSLLIHCSDGWDRTAQVCVLTQILLDPHYRTLRGLATLLDKDLVAFGHKCRERLGFDAQGPYSNEWSPVILQLLDAIWQLLNQFPTAFEFNGDALRYLALVAHSGRAGQFLWSTDHERDAEGVRAIWASAWPQLEAHRGAYTNDRYSRWPLERGPLYATASLQRLRVWEMFVLPPELLAQHELMSLAWACVASDGGLMDSRSEVHCESWCHAFIRETSRGVDSRGNEFTHYHITMEDDGDEGEDAKVVVVKRRFNDFLALDAAVRAHASNAVVAELPPLPTSLTFNKLSSSVVSSRVEALQRYIAFICTSTELGQLAAVTQFFGGLFAPPPTSGPLPPAPYGEGAVAQW